MSDRPTPETDALILSKSGFGPTDWEWRLHSRRLECERDKAREEASRAPATSKPPEHGRGWPPINSLLNDAIDCFTDADICSGMGMAAHSLGYLQLAMGKLAQAETQLKGNTR